jgi:hypothetical protein
VGRAGGPPKWIKPQLSRLVDLPVEASEMFVID